MVWISQAAQALRFPRKQPQTCLTALFPIGYGMACGCILEAWSVERKIGAALRIAPNWQAALEPANQGEAWPGNRSSTWDNSESRFADLGPVRPEALPHDPRKTPQALWNDAVRRRNWRSSSTSATIRSRERCKAANR